jgi:quercetin dioxygenase-like cupin family protein
MSSMTRLLTAPNLTFDLLEQIRELRSDDAYVRSGRVGRTLAKQGSLRLTLVVLRKGIDVGTHHADHPMTLQPIEGRLRYRVEGQGEEFEIGAGQVLYFGPGHAQDIRALEDTALLLTITARGDEG